MSTFKRATGDTVTEVLRKLTIQVQNEHDPDAREAWAESVNEWLDDLVSLDTFGTEGQLDPRGDHRD